MDHHPIGLAWHGVALSHLTKTMIEHLAVPLAHSLSLVNELQVVSAEPLAGAPNLPRFVRTTNHVERRGVLRGILPEDGLCHATLQAAMKSAPDLLWSSELQCSFQEQAAPWTSSVSGFVTEFLNEARDQDHGFLLQADSLRLLNLLEPDDQERIGIAAQELLGTDIQIIHQSDDSVSINVVGSVSPDFVNENQQTELVEASNPHPLSMELLAERLERLPIYFGSNQQIIDVEQGRKILKAAALISALELTDKPSLILAGSAD